MCVKPWTVFTYMFFHVLVVYCQFMFNLVFFGIRNLHYFFPRGVTYTMSFLMLLPSPAFLFHSVFTGQKSLCARSLCDV